MVVHRHRPLLLPAPTTCHAPGGRGGGGVGAGGGGGGNGGDGGDGGTLHLWAATTFVRTAGAQITAVGGNRGDPGVEGNGGAGAGGAEAGARGPRAARGTNGGIGAITLRGTGAQTSFSSPAATVRVP